jgi:hypothetical protein
MSSTLTNAQIQAQIAEKKKNIKCLSEKKTELHKTNARIAKTKTNLAARSACVQEREEFIQQRPEAKHDFDTFAAIKQDFEQLNPLYAEEDFLRGRLEEVQKKIQVAETSYRSHRRTAHFANVCRGTGYLTVSDRKKKLSSTPGVVADRAWRAPTPRVKLSAVPESERRRIHREDMLHHQCNPDLPRYLYDNCKRDFHLIARQRGWIEDEGITFDSVLERKAGGSYVKAVKIMETMRRHAGRYHR